jgi:hypothetical protein
MRRDTRDELLRGFLAINAMLREEVRGIRRSLQWRTTETKYNSNWAKQPRAPKGTSEGGQWVDGGGIDKLDPAPPKPSRGNTPKNQNNRTPRDHNRPGLDSLRQLFPGMPNAPASAILAPIDSLLGISGPGIAANDEAVRNLRDELISDIQQLRPSYRFQSIDPGGMPPSIAGRNAMLDSLRLERAAAIYQVRGTIEPLQVETLRFVQRRVDTAYERAVQLYNSGQLSARLNRNEAIGNYVDAAVRRSLRSLYPMLGVSINRGEPVQVNRRARTISELTYTIPDARVGNVIFDATLANKAPRSPQIIRFFQSHFEPVAAIIIRPSQLGQGHTYLITPPPPVAPGG